MSKYRFKTEEEFKRDGLWLRNYPNNWTSSGSMNKFLGQDIPDEYNRFCDVNKDFAYQGWSFLGNNYVLKESPVVESPKEIDMNEIQEEAKKRFPIGCKFIPVDSSNTYTLIEDSCTYKIHGKYIWAHDMHGHLYGDSKWATLVSLPETTKEMFYKGDYIVTLINDANCGKVNYCSKQSKDSDYLQPVIDTKGYPNNGNSKFLSTDTSNTKWRYATPEEATEYERIGKPYDVTTLQKKEESIPEYVECIKSLSKQKIGDIEKTSEVPKWTSGWSKESFWGAYYPSHYKPSTKEAYETQNTPKQLTKEDLVEGEIYIYDGSQIAIYPEGPNVDFNGHYIPNPKWLWSLSITHATEEQKDFLRSCIKKHEKVEPMSQLWLEDPIVEQKINTLSIKKETFIDNVQSVDVALRTKRKSFKF